ncbi:unnamed protein product [Closterium sp. Yama58-4]|nr:unnamed protein product [Closterium sp. Yama58-4]
MKATGPSSQRLPRREPLLPAAFQSPLPLLVHLAAAALVGRMAAGARGSDDVAATAGDSQATAAALLAVAALNLTRSPISALFVFGDSLVDVGNNNHGTHRFLRADLPPYGINYKPASGRFSDGRLQIDFLARYLGLPSPPPVLQPGRSATRGLNFASAGAGVLDATNRGQTFPLSFQLGKFREVHAAVVGQDGSEQGSGSNESAGAMLNGGDAGSVGSASSSSSSSSSEESLPDKSALASALYVVQVGSNDYLYLLSHLNMGLVPNIPTSLPPRNATRSPRFRNASSLPRLLNTTALPPPLFNSTALPSASLTSAASAASASTVQPASSPERTAAANNVSDSTGPAVRLRRAGTRGVLPLEEAVSRPPQSVTDTLASVGRLSAALGPTIAASSQGTVDAVQTLYSMGARRFLVYLLPPIACAPTLMQALGQRTCSASPLSAVPVAHNAVLTAGLHALQARLPGMVILTADVGAFVVRAVEQPHALGFTNGPEACCGGPAPLNGLVQCGRTALVNGTPTRYTLCRRPSRHVFWDAFHPSQRLNHLLAARVWRGSEGGWDADEGDGGDEGLGDDVGEDDGGSGVVMRPFGLRALARYLAEIE